MEKSVAASEAALEELEQAMDAVEKTQKAAASILNPTTPPPPEGEKEGDKGSEPA
jgi:segregation and condensation protein B